MKKIITFTVILFLAVVVSGISLVTQPLLLNTEISSERLEVAKSDSDTLERHVKTLSSYERFTDEGLEKSSSYILEILEKDGVEEQSIEIQTYTIGEREYKNIIVHFKQSGERKILGPKYIVGAHYDSHEKLPAADDNASGVAGILEIARILNQTKMWHQNIDLVFYSTEEMPHFRTQNMGSYQHASSNQDVDLAIILEMIGYFSEEQGSQEFPVKPMKYLYGDSGNFIALVSNFENIFPVRNIKGYFSTYLEENNFIGVESINAPSSIPGIDFSDHQSYWKFDIPAIMITDTAFYRNRNYHTLEDTYEKLDYKKMKEVVDAVVVTVLSLGVF